jgi:cell wall-associated NlpC family hydrolase
MGVPVNTRRLLPVLALLAVLLTFPALTAAPAHASAAQPAHAMTWGGSHAGNVAMNWARANTWGHWYLYGGTGPSYDCSGLVMVAFSHAGIALPHSTYSMPGNRHLHRVYSPQRGDLAFFGTGHVEIVTAWWHQTFGAHHSGTRIGYRTWDSYYHPTAFYRVW